MWMELAHLTGVLLHELDRHAELCRADRPDRQALATVRWKLVEAGRRRMLYLVNEALPVAERSATPANVVRLRAVGSAAPVYWARVTALVNRWTPDAIDADWQGYISTCKAFGAGLRQRLAEERDVLRFALPRAMAADQPQDRHPLSPSLPSRP